MHLNNGLDSSETEHTNENLTSEQLWNAKYVLFNRKIKKETI